jgi:hypothetical protein
VFINLKLEVRVRPNFCFLAVKGTMRSREVRYGTGIFLLIIHFFITGISRDTGSGKNNEIMKK